MSSRRNSRRRDQDREELVERIVDITRVAKVIKGGRRFAFRTVMIVGDGKGKVGMGIGKARGVPDAIRKANDRGRKNMKNVALVGSTIPHEIRGKCGGAVVFLKPAAPGTGVIAAGAVRAVVEAAGIHDILTKSEGSSNVLNVARATLNALDKLMKLEDLAERRGVPKEKLLPFWNREGDEAAPGGA